MERDRLDDWKFQGFGAPVQDGGEPRMYTGLKLERMGLTREGNHSALDRIGIIDRYGNNVILDVYPVVWPPNAGEGEKVITLFVPVEQETRESA